MEATNQINTIFDVFDAIFNDLDSLTIESPVYKGNFPPFDLKVNEETKDVVFEFAVAGISKEEINLSVEGDYFYLEIKPNEKDEENYKVLQHGLKKSHVKRKFLIPSSKYSIDKIEVELKEGILKVFIPAKEEIKPKLLKIK